jgi:hypothetical protein
MTALAAVFLHAAWMGSPLRVADSRELVQTLGLTDICLFTEARYTRHLALADYSAAFQDHPGAWEHFPSGALVAPPWKAPHVQPAP